MIHRYTIVALAAAAVLAGSCSKAALGADYGGMSNAREMSRAAFADEYKTAELPAAVSEAVVQEDAAHSAAQNATYGRKMIKRAYLRLRVEDQAGAEQFLAQLMERYDAWPESSEASDYSLSYSIRVPSPLYGAMLADIAALGRVLRRTETTEDVTLRYYDLESRLATKRELLKTFQGYLEKANDIDEIMTVESRIADLQREIDQTGAQFRGIVNQVDYAVITVEVFVPSAVSSPSKDTLGDKMERLFSSFGDVVSTALVALTGILIYGIPAAVLLIAGFWILFGRIGLLRRLFALATVKKKPKA